MTNSQSGAQPQPFSGMNLAGAVDLEALKHKVDAAAGESGGAPAAGGYVTDVDSSGFESMVRMSATYPILLLMWQSDDNRYFDLAGKLADIVNGLKGQIQLARMDIGSNPEIVQALRMQGAPALYALIGGRPMPILQGMPSDDELAQVRDQILPQLIAAARQSGVTGNAPYIGDGSPDSSGGTQGSGGQDASDAGAAGPSGPQIPAGHEEAYGLPVTVNMRRLRLRIRRSPNPIPVTVLRRVSMPRLRFSTATALQMCVLCARLQGITRTAWRPRWMWPISI